MRFLWCLIHIPLWNLLLCGVRFKSELSWLAAGYKLISFRNLHWNIYTLACFPWISAHLPVSTGISAHLPVSTGTSEHLPVSEGCIETQVNGCTMNSPQTSLVYSEHPTNRECHDNYLFVSLPRERARSSGTGATTAKAFVSTSTENVRDTDQRDHNRCGSLGEAQETRRVPDEYRCCAPFQMFYPSPLRFS